jgi:N-acetylneuraminic acid mutarotase
MRRGPLLRRSRYRGTMTPLPTPLWPIRSGGSPCFPYGYATPQRPVPLAGGCSGCSDPVSIALDTAEVYDPVSNTFTALTATMTTPRALHTATRLPSILVLLTGGANDTGAVLKSAELYDPTAQTFTALTAKMNTARGGHAAILLPNGQVLLTGGGSFSKGNFGSLVALKTAEVYDPIANTFTALAVTMTTARVFHTMTLLPNGLGLVTGGANRTTTLHILDTAEAYEALPPSANTFTALTATMTTPRLNHTATLLPNGPVLVTGGTTTPNGNGLNTAELYNPTAQTFTPPLPATMTTPRGGHTATLLPNGQVLITGGYNNSSAHLNTAELYDSVAQTFTALAATMTTPRQGHTATLLPGGQVLLTGGYDGTSPTPALKTAELYDPTTETFTALTAAMTTARAFHTATLLPDGFVLLTGGANGTGLALDTAEVYDP